jgi:hypothetical protein
MTIVSPHNTQLDPVFAASALKDFGFLASPDPPVGPGPAFLLVAIREAPTLRHYDPEAVEYWVTEAGRGVLRTLTGQTRLPIQTEFSWGLIRIVDRLKVTNSYLAFGGRLSADVRDGTVVAVFTSPAPLLRRGGHSQGWDEGADSVGAFFSRFLRAVDYAPGFEGRVARADPLARYAAFLVDGLSRYRASAALRDEQPELWRLLQAEERRLRASHSNEWVEGEALWREATSTASG